MNDCNNKNNSCLPYFPARGLPTVFGQEIDYYTLASHAWAKACHAFEWVKNTDFKGFTQDVIDKMIADGTFYSVVGDYFKYQKLVPADVGKTAYGVYVSINGSDETGDGTESNPYQTINHAIEYCGYTYTDIRIYLITAGDYNISYTTLSANLHLTATANGVSVTLQNSLRNYGSHSTIQSTATTPLTINCNDYSWYFDGHTLFSNCIINGLVQVSDTGIRFNKCEVSNISATNSFVELNSCTLIQPTSRLINNAFYLINSITYFNNIFTINLSENYSGYFLYALGGIINLSIPFTALNDYKFANTYIHWSNLLMSINSIATIESLCTSTDIAYNITPFLTREYTFNLNTTNLNTATSTSDIYNEYDRGYHFKLSANFARADSGRKGYSYYTVNDVRVIPMYVSSSNYFNMNNDDIKLIGYASMMYESTAGVFDSTSVPVVVIRYNNVTHIGIVYNNTNTNFICDISYDGFTTLPDYQ